MRAAIVTSGQDATTPAGGVPLLARQAAMLAREGVKAVAVTLRGPTAAIDDTLATAGLCSGVPVRLDQGGAPPSDEPAIVVDGPALFDLTVTALLNAHRDHALTVVAHPTLAPRSADLLGERDGRVTALFRRDRPNPSDQRNLSPAGVFLAQPDVLPTLLASGPLATIETLLAAGAPIGCAITTEYVRRLDRPESRAAAEHDLAAGLPERLRLAHRRPGLLVDIDGVLNRDVGDQGMQRPDDVVLVPGAGEALVRARAAGFVIACATNRAQVAHGDVTLDGLDRILGRLEALLADNGGYLDRIYFCPHHPEKRPGGVPALQIACACRKPAPGLLLRALAELPIDPARTVMIGDSLRDVGAAIAAGVRPYGVATGHGCKDLARYAGRPDVPMPERMFADIGEAVDAVIAGAAR